MTRIRVLLADDHTLIRAGVRALLGTIPGVEVVAESGQGQETVELIEKHRPDVAILDIGMPGLNGVEVAARAAKVSPKTRVIMLSMHADPSYIRQALRAGASGYLLKEAAVEELPLALNAVMRGESYLTPKVSQAVVQYERIILPSSSLVKWFTSSPPASRTSRVTVWFESASQ